MRFGAIVTAVVLAVLFARPAPADVLDDCNQSAEQDIRIAGCTQSLETLKLDNKSRANVHIRRGDAYANKKDYDRALADYNEAIRLEPASAEAYNGRGVVYDKQGQPDRAIDDFDQALRHHPKYSEAYRNRGVAYSHKGKLERAIVDFDFATRLDPNNVRAYNDRATINAKLGRIDLAVADFDRAIKLSANPSDTETFQKNRADALAAAQTAPKPQPATQVSFPSASCPAALIHWSSVESIKTVAAYEDHIARFPNCAFVTLANERIAALKQKASAELPPPVVAAPALPASPPKSQSQNPPTSAAKPAPAPAPVARVTPEPAKPRPVARTRPVPRARVVQRTRPVERPRAPVETSSEARSTGQTLDCTNPAGLIGCWGRIISTMPIAQPITPRGAGR